MPEYLAPGVFVEETSFRSKSIEGVGTSVAGLVGPTRTGPVRGVPEVVTSFGEFSRVYGDVMPLQFSEGQRPNYAAMAAKAFFDNGGKQLFVARTIAGVNGTDRNGAGGSAQFARRTDAAGNVTFNSRFPGAAGNYTLEFRWRDSENLLTTEVTSAPADGEVVFLEATGVPATIRATGVPAAVPPARFPMDIRAIARRDGDHYVIVNNGAEITTADGTDVTAADLAPAGETEGFLMREGLEAGAAATFRMTRVAARQPINGSLAGGTAAALFLTAETDLSAFTGAGHWGTLTTLRGTLNAAGTEMVIDGDGLNAGVTADVTLPLAALSASLSTTRAIVVQRNFDIDVRLGGPDGEVVYTYGNVSASPSGDSSLATVLDPAPDKRADQLGSPVSCALRNGAGADAIVAALFEMFDAAALTPPPLSASGPRYLVTLAGGTDGDLPGAVDYGGETDEVNGSTGFAALEDIEDVSIVMTPAAAAETATHQAVVAEMQKHCLKMRYRVGIVDAQQGMSLGEVRAFRSNFDDSRLALYYPWVVAADPTGQVDNIELPPSGFMAGVYANTDVTRGVHKAPANEVVVGALRFAQEINRFQQELLNPNGINCLRSFPGRGHRVWGGRTMASDPEWKYLNVRRYFLYLERSIDKSTQWVVFEPNGDALWDNVRATVEGFLYNEWFNGHLLGESPDKAYFVRCDRSTMTQADIDNGRLVCLIGVAPLNPAEFVIFRIGQMTADAQG